MTVWSRSRRDGGAHWTNVTSNIPDLPPWGTVSNIEPSRYDAGTAYITVDFHQVNNRDPYRLQDRRLRKELEVNRARIFPEVSIAMRTACVKTRCAKECSIWERRTRCMYRSMTVRSWTSLQNNLPHAPVHDLALQDHFNDLVVGHLWSRISGFWMTSRLFSNSLRRILDSDVHLFTPRPAYRFQRLETTMDIPDHGHAGHNPPYGASINYYLKTVPDGDIRIEVLDETGQTIKTLPGTRNLGINRIWWDSEERAITENQTQNEPPLCSSCQGWTRRLETLPGQADFLPGRARNLHSDTNCRRKGDHPEAGCQEGSEFGRNRGRYSSSSRDAARALGHQQCCCGESQSD